MSTIYYFAAIRNIDHDFIHQTPKRDGYDPISTQIATEEEANATLFKSTTASEYEIRRFILPAAVEDHPRSMITRSIT